MKTLEHTDKVVPNLKFINDYLIKTLFLSVPQALHQEMKEQLNQILETNIIQRNCSEWAYAILLDKKV